MVFTVLRTSLPSRRFSPLIYALVNVHTFSTTASTFKVKGPLPTFKPTSNAELDDLLKFIHEELFVPTHLLKKHRQLMLRPKNHHTLEEEPLTVNVSGGQIELKPRGPEVPVRVKLFGKAMDLMKEPSDLDALPGLVLGFSQANRSVRLKQLEEMARFINMHGRVDLLMQISRAAGTNGFKFTKPVAREFMRGLRMVNAVPDRDVAIKALRDAENLLNYLGDPRMKKIPDERLKRDPVVVGTYLSMVASTCMRFFDKKDCNNDTISYAERLRACWCDMDWGTELLPGDRKSVWRAKSAVLDHLPVFDGLVQAREVLHDSKLKPWLEAQCAKLNIHLTERKEFLDKESADKKPYGQHSYREVTDRLTKELQSNSA